MKYLQNQVVYLLFVAATLRYSLKYFYTVFSFVDFLVNSCYTHPLLSCIPAVCLLGCPYYSAPSLGRLLVSEHTLRKGLPPKLFFTLPVQSVHSQAYHLLTLSFCEDCKHPYIHPD